MPFPNQVRLVAQSTHALGPGGLVGGKSPRLVGRADHLFDALLRELVDRWRGEVCRAPSDIIVAPVVDQSEHDVRRLHV
eukprot:4175983-Prymnesium_polylepis.1